MAFAKRLSHEYHDGGLFDVRIGPRQEVALTIRLDPVWNNGDETEKTIQISAIANFAEVKAFFEGLRPR